jgi:hypothetical protein
MNCKAALLGADTLAARAFRDHCEARRLPDIAWHLFTDDEAVLTASAEGAEVILPESQEALDAFPLLLDFHPARKAPLRTRGTLLHAGAGAPVPGAALVFSGADSSPLMKGAPCSAPHPLSSVLLRVMGCRPIAGMASGHIVVVASTQEEGRAGQDELFNQTVALINAGAFKSRVYKEQVAYNLVPAPTGALGARLRAELEAFWGEGWLAPVQVAKAGVFYGALAAVHLAFGDPAKKRAFAAGLRANPALFREEKGSRGLVRAVQSEDIFLSPGEESDRSLQFWVCTDPFRSGMAWNLAGLVESFFQTAQSTQTGPS